MKKLITIREACTITSLSRTTLWSKSIVGKFPTPVSLGGGRKAFLASEVEEWIDARLLERDGVHRPD